MKKSKKIIGLGLALAMCFGALSGCGEDSPEKETTQATQSTKVPETKPSETTAPTETGAPSDATEPPETSAPVDDKPEVPLVEAQCLTGIVSLRYSAGYGAVMEDFRRVYAYDDAYDLIRKAEFVNEELTYEALYDGDPERPRSEIDYYWGDSTDYEYDTNGNLIKKTEDGIDYTYTYDEAGNLIEETRRSKNFHGEWETDSTVNEYDEVGNLISTTMYDDGEEQQKWVDVYNEHGDLVEEMVYVGGEAYQVTTYTYEYDENGNKTLEICFEDGLECSRCAYVYDEAGRLIEKLEAVYKIAGEYDEGKNYRYVYSYNSEGVLIEESYYDTLGNIVYCNKFIAAGRPLERQEYEYDSLYDVNELIFTYTYTYDSFGNLIALDGAYADGTVGERTVSQTYTYETVSVPEEMAGKLQDYIDTMTYLG